MATKASPSLQLSTNEGSEVLASLGGVVAEMAPGGKMGRARPSPVGY